MEEVFQHLEKYLTPWKYLLQNERILYLLHNKNIFYKNRFLCVDVLSIILNSKNVKIIIVNSDPTKPHSSPIVVNM